MSGGEEFMGSPRRREPRGFPGWILSPDDDSGLVGQRAWTPATAAGMSEVGRRGRDRDVYVTPTGLESLVCYNWLAVQIGAEKKQIDEAFPTDASI